MSKVLFEVSGLNSYLPSAERRQHLIKTGKYANSIYYIADCLDESVFQILTDTDMLVMLMFMNGFRQAPTPNGQDPLPLLKYTMLAFQKEIEYKIINSQDKLCYGATQFRRSVALYLRKVALDLRIRIKPDDLVYGNDRIYMFDLGDKGIV